MDPIGASDTWRFHGYDNSDVELDRRTMKSVPGGTGRQIVSQSWIERATTSAGPGSRTDYGYLWWLAQPEAWPEVPKSSFAAVGDGSNTIWIDPEHDLVVVWRWYRGDSSEFFKRILAALDPGRAPVVTVTENDPDVVRVGENGVKVPARLTYVAPVLPAGVDPQGTIVVELLVSRTGTVDRVSLLKAVQPPQPALDVAAMDAARQWTFSPTLVDGVARPVKTRYAFFVSTWK
jgi:TonB family protein